MANRPLSSLLAVKLRGEASGFSAMIVAPLIGSPRSSLTIPVTRPDCAAALARQGDQQDRSEEACPHGASIYRAKRGSKGF